MPALLKLFLIALVSCLCLAGCTDHASIEKAKALEAELEQMSRLNSQAQATLKRLDSKVEGARQDNVRLKEDNARLQGELDGKGKEIEKLKKDFEDYKLKYKLGMKTRVPGMKVDDFTVDGTVYHNVILKEITDASLTVAHENGVRKLDLAQLPEPLRDRLGLNITVRPVKVAQELPEKKTKSLMMAKNEEQATQAEEQKSAIMIELEEAKVKLQIAKYNLSLAAAKDIKALKKTIDEQETLIGKLESKAVQADLKAYQARQERNNMLAR